MITTLATMYASVFGDFAEKGFLFGAVMVALFYAVRCYSKSCARRNQRGESMQRRDVARGESSRVCADVQYFHSICAFATLLFFRNPVTLILIGGLAQALLLPVLGGMALYYRNTELPKELRGSKLWGASLWFPPLLSCLSLVGSYTKSSSP